jgi:TonB family protein
VLLHYVQPESWNRYGSRPRDEIEMKTVLLTVVVSAEGRIHDAKIVDDSGDTRHAEQTVRAANTARYRPRFENGQSVDTPDVSFSQSWVVLRPKEAAAEPAKDAGKQP